MEAIEYTAAGLMFSLRGKNGSKLRVWKFGFLQCALVFFCFETFVFFCLEQTFGMNFKHVCCMFWHGDMLAFCAMISTTLKDIQEVSVKKCVL